MMMVLHILEIGSREKSMEKVSKEEVMVLDMKGNFIFQDRGFHLSKREGKGVAEYDNGLFHDGTFKDDKFVEGNGRMFLVGDKRYEG